MSRSTDDEQTGERVERIDDPAEVAAPSAGSSGLVSATMIMAAGTGLSRVLGFVKASMIAAALGITTRQAEMFAVANVIPQAIYLLLAGGVLNTVFVPQIVRAMKNDPDGGEAYTNRLLTLGLSAIALITIAATALAPVIMGDIYLNASWKSPALDAHYDAIILLSYLCLPQIFFYGVNVMIGQVLNARGKFGPMMWSPIANNLIGIGSIVLFLILWPGERDLGEPFSSGQILVLGLGATAGIVAQALVLIPFLRSVDFRFRPRFDFRNSGLGRAAQVAKWTVGYMIVTQLALVVVTRLANGAPTSGEGSGWAVYQFANLIFMLPHSLITVSLATAMLPHVSRLVVADDLDGARAETMQTMRLAITALLPAAVAFLALAHPIANVLFGHGKGEQDWPWIAWTLMAFSVGLVPFTLQYLCLRAFYALEDTRTTFLVQILIASVNVAAALALVLPFDDPHWVAVGLALAYALAYLVGFGLSFRLLGRRLPGLRAAEIGRHCVRVFLAVLPAGLLAYAITWAFGLWSTELPARVLGLAVAGLVAVGSYLAMARMLHIAEVSQIIGTVVRRRSSGKQEVSSDRGHDDQGVRGDRLDIDSLDSGGSGLPGAAASDTISPELGSSVDSEAARPGMTGGQARQAAGSQSRDQDQTVPGGPADLEATNPNNPRIDPATDPIPDAEQTAEFTLAELEAEEPPSEADHLPAGSVLAKRYRLEELLAWTGASVTWRAFDQVLSRSVVIHLLPVGDPRSAALLAAGRRAAGATDSRFLRVLDAVEEGGVDADGNPVGTYIVSEYAKGQALQTVLQAAPLTGLESAWVVREVADALTSAHVRGLPHRRLNPETVIITPNGNVKIVGLLVEAALRPDEYATDQQPSDEELIATDVTDLGRLLYACLVARWPDGPAFGLPAAPLSGGSATDEEHSWLTPRQVRHGVSPTLDRISDQLLSPVPRQRSYPIRSATDLVAELDKVLGSADATGDLERRLRHPQPSYLSEETEPHEPGHDPAPETYALVHRTGSIAAGTNTGEGNSVQQSSASPDPAETAPEQTRRGPRRWIFVLVVLLLICAIVVTVLTARGLGVAPPTIGEPDKSAAAPAPPEPVEIVDADDFDPPPGNGNENPDEVRYVFDKDPETRWRTLLYLGSPDLGNLKPGVGVVLDLGEPRRISKVELQLSGDDTDFQIRVPRGDSAAEEADMDSLRSWRTVAQTKGAGESATATLKKTVESRYVLVFLTSLPKEGGEYRGGIYEAEVLS
jgi:putative peptidoglycan lipid II flippase